MSDWDRVEDDFINDSQRMKGYRLACCARIEADVAVFVPEESRAGKQVVSKAARDIRINHDPAVKAIKSSLLAMLPVMGQGSLFSIAKNEWKRPGLPASWNMSN